MYFKPISIIAMLVLLMPLAGTLKMVAGQQKQQPPKTDPPQPPALLPEQISEIGRPKLDLAKLPYHQRQIYLATQRGIRWLVHSNRPDGRFIDGIVPSLAIQLSENDYLGQIAATCTLARAGKFLYDDRAATVARQAMLTLLLSTEKDAAKPEMRRPTFAPSEMGNLEAASQLVLAIHELPATGADLLRQADELCNYIGTKIGRDGTLAMPDQAGTVTASKSTKSDASAAVALCALLRNAIRTKNTDETIKLVRSAQKHYHQKWQTEKDQSSAPWFSALYVEAYFLTKDPVFAEAVFEINDWLCTIQYKHADPQHLHWMGGFPPPTAEGQMLAPTVHTALCLDCLIGGLRVAREKGDVQRFQNYRQAIERAAQFLVTLQYTEANTQHFMTWYREEIAGAFHRSHQDGIVRTGFTQMAVAAMISYLQEMIE